MITHVAGTRPTDVKIFALWPELNKRNLEQQVVHTGQHFSAEMRAVGLKIDEYGNCTNDLGRMMTWLMPRLQGTVVVYGDTNSSLAGAMVAKQKCLRLIHVEAGMRCGDTAMVEENNRKAIDAIADRNFVTSSAYIKNVPEGTGEITGDLQYDLFKRRLEQGRIPMEEGFPLLTLHRAEHTQEGLEDLLGLLASKFDWPIYFPIHPRTLQYCLEHQIRLDSFQIMDPLPYFQFQEMILKAGAVITDSGGVSKEAIWALKPCYILREVSEWGLPTVGHWGEKWREMRPGESKLDSGDGHAAKKIGELLQNE